MDTVSGRAAGASPLSRIAVVAGTFVNSGRVHADGPSGGQVLVQAGNILNAGPITADGYGPEGNGGQVQMAFTGFSVATTAGLVSASGSAGPGGQVLLDGGSTGRLYSSGGQWATGWVGGAVTLLGHDIVLAGATVNAWGGDGGGVVRIGSDFAGPDSSGDATATLLVTPASSIQANALASGSGGQVFIGANQSETFDGSVSARGGPGGGAGGFIDVSGRQT